MYLTIGLPPIPLVLPAQKLKQIRPIWGMRNAGMQYIMQKIYGKEQYVEVAYREILDWKQCSSKDYRNPFVSH